MVSTLTQLLLSFRPILVSKIADRINDLIIARPSWVLAHGAKVLYKTTQNEDFRLE